MKKEIINFDGRALEIYTQGTPSNEALIFHHGGLGSTLNMAPLFREVKDKNIFAVGITRPGYAGSSRRPGRRAHSYLGDTQIVLRHLGIEHIVSLGWSSGAPAALADTLGVQSKGAISISGDAPKGNSDWPDYELKYPAKNREESYGNSSSLELSEVDWRVIQADQLSESFGENLSKSDLHLVNGAWGPELAQAIRDGMSPGEFGLLDDLESDSSDWGFDLSSITKPVAIFQGDEDRFDIPGNGHYLSSHIPNSELILIPGEGHISLIYNHSEHIIDKALDFLYR